MATVEELFAGDVVALARDYPQDPTSTGGCPFDHSRADLALFVKLLERCNGNVAQADQLFRNSELMRDKWERPDYVERTVGRAVAAYRAKNDVAVVFGPVDPLAPVVALKFHLEPFKDVELSRNATGLIGGVMDLDSLVAVVGKSGSAKTFVTLDMFLSIARGVPWMGHPVRQGLVIYVAAEGGNGVKKRLEAYRRTHGVVDLPFYLLSVPVDLLSREDEVGHLVAAIQAIGQPCTAVCVDTLSMSMPGGDENAPADMTRAVDSLKRINRALGCTVVAVHHLGKSEGRGARGHSSFYAALDTELTCSREGDEGFAVTATKQREMDGELKHFYRLRRVGLGPDSEGREISSCIVEETGEPVPEGPRAPACAVAVDECYAAIIISQGVDIPDTNGVDVGACRTAVIVRQNTTPGDQPDSQTVLPDNAKRSFRRGLNWLKEHGIYGENDGRMYKL